MTSMTNHISKVLLNYNEAIWCADVLSSLRFTILNIMIIFGPKTLTFIRGVQRNYGHLTQSLGIILDKWEDISIPEVLSFIMTSQLQHVQ